MQEIPFGEWLPPTRPRNQTTGRAYRALCNTEQHSIALRFSENPSCRIFR